MGANNSRTVVCLVMGCVLAPAAGFVLATPPWTWLLISAATPTYLAVQQVFLVRRVAASTGPDPLPATVDHVTDRLRIRRLQ